ncbi:MAG: CNNM domain-containing protein, partial [Candidatus Hydrogenedentota bacterium]
MIAVTLGLIALFLFSVVLQGLFAGYEIGFIASNPIRVRYLAEEENNSRAKRLFDHLQQPDHMLTLLLIGNNLTLVAGTVAITRAFGSFPYAEAAATIVATTLFLLFSEIIPKSIFRVYPTQLSMTVLPVVQFFHVGLLPVTRPIALFTRSLLRLAGHEREHLSPF